MTHLIKAAALATLLIAPAPIQAETPIHLVQSRGTLVQSAENISSVLIADPTIADVQPLSENTVFVFGKSIGVTELFMLDDNQQLLERRSVSVTRSLASMQASQRTASN